MFRERPRRPMGQRVRRRATDEADFMNQIIEMATRLGWMSYHTHDSRRSPPGYPDLTLVKGSRLIFAEVKTERGIIKKEQKIWLAALSQVPGLEVFLWRPSQAEEIIRILQST